MRTLMVQPHGWGGIHNYTVALVSALADDGVDVTMLGASDADWHDLPVGVHVEPELESFQQTRKLPPVVRRARSLVLHVRNAVRLRHRGMSSPVDVVHFQWPPQLFARRVLRDIARAHPLVMTVHNVLPHDDSKAGSSQVRRWWGDIYGMADVLICHSEHSAEEVGRVFGAALQRRAAVIPHGVGSPAWSRLQLPTREEARKALGLPPSRSIVLFLGSALPYKGLDVLLRAVAGSGLAEPPLLLVAGWCPDWTPYETLLQQPGAQARVLIHDGWVPEEVIPRYMAAADALALPYQRIDASGIAAIGAFFGVPLLLSDIPGFRAVWGQDEALFLPPDDERAWAKAMDAVVADAAAVRSVGKAAQTRAARDMSWHVCAQAHVRAYEGAIARRRSRSR